MRRGEHFSIRFWVSVLPVVFICSSIGCAIAYHRELGASLDALATAGVRLLSPTLLSKIDARDTRVWQAMPAIGAALWYRIRIRVRVESGPNVKLALAGPAQVDDAYQVFDNGLLVGTFGDFSARNPGIYYARPMVFPLPQPADAGLGESTQVIAFRIRMQPRALFQASEVGGFESAPLLGEAAALASVYQVLFDEFIRTYLWAPIEGIVCT